MTRIAAMSTTVLLLLLLPGAPAALAAAPVGACCLANRICEDLIEVQCDDRGGSFIGAGASCAQIDCALPVAAPLLSIAGLVAAFGALAGLGLYRLASRRAR